MQRLPQHKQRREIRRDSGDISELTLRLVQWCTVHPLLRINSHFPDQISDVSGKRVILGSTNECLFGVRKVESD